MIFIKKGFRCPGEIFLIGKYIEDGIVYFRSESEYSKEDERQFGE